MTGLLPDQRSATEPLAPSVAARGFDFVAFDVETANYHRGSVCAVGAVEVRAGEVVATHSWLTRPPADLDFFDGFNVSLHGITPDMVADQPSFAERLDQLVDLAGGLPLIAHNAAFDMGAIREGCTYEDRPWPTVDYACSLVMARRALDLISYRLPLVAHECGVDLAGHHDAGMDALACAHIVLEIARRRGAASLPALLTDLQMLMGHLDPRMWEGCRAKPRWGYPPPPEAAPDADLHHPLYGQVMVFTGALSIRRQDAWAAVAACGATPEQGVTKRTTMLVVGDGFSGNDPAEFYTGKAAKAARWRAKGHPIEVLTEADLAELLAERRTSGLAAVPA
jgi:DNA polymerase-3 subunit epsilon